MTSLTALSRTKVVAAIVGVIAALFFGVGIGTTRTFVWGELGQYNSHGTAPFLCEGEAKELRSGVVSAAASMLSADISGCTLSVVTPKTGYHMYWTQRRGSLFSIWMSQSGFRSQRPGEEQTQGGAIDIMLVQTGQTNYFGVYDRRTHGLKSLVETSDPPSPQRVWEYAVAVLKSPEVQTPAAPPPKP